MRAAFKKKPPPPLTPERLDHIALRYVSRYAATEAMLEKVLRRHLQRALFADPDIPRADLEQKITAILRRFAEKGWVDDSGLAKRFAEQARAGGFSKQKIKMKLQAKGISRAMIHDILSEEEDQEEKEWQAALIFARRKRLGPWRKNDDAVPDKEIAKLCRAGFSLDTARKIMRHKRTD